MRPILSLFLTLLVSATTLAQQVEDFTFLQISDMHLNPRPEGQPYDLNGRSIENLQWIASQTNQPQHLTPYNITAPAPDLAIITGDLLEYSVIGETWNDLYRVLNILPTDNYLLAGNHDNTWASINHKLREHFGGDNYAFFHKGIHFIQINSAGLLEPLPAIERRTLTWLEQQLKRIGTETPIVLSLHHPLIGSNSFASEFDTLRLHELLRGHNIILIMDGHWHNAQTRKWHHFDSVCGGTTFGDNTGYSTLSILDNTLRVAYRFKNPDRPMQGLIEKPLTTKPPHLDTQLLLPPRLEHNQTLRVGLRIDAPQSHINAVNLRINGNPESSTPLKPVNDTWMASINTSNMVPGRHFATIDIQHADGETFTRAGEFLIQPDPQVMSYDLQRMDAGSKTTPTLLDQGVAVADTNGLVLVYNHDLSLRWYTSTGAQIVHSLTRHNDQLLVGSDDGTLRFYLATTGRLDATYNAKAPIYAPAVAANNTIYLADASGRVHAINHETAKPIWITKAADYAIEQAPLITKDLVIVGAWDGMIHVLDRATGEKRWSAWSAKGQTDRQSRYYGPADSPLVAIDNNLFVTDRGYVLGQFNLDGDFIRTLDTDISAISSSQDGPAFYARAVDNRLIKFNAQGDKLWETPVPTGRLPTPPTQRGNIVAVTSNDGLLSILSASDGSLINQLRVSPGTYVQAAPAIDAQGRIHVVDLDGVLSRIQLHPQP
ncbi:MAG: PQQ-binding-like beta-propeller repeat protein [Phycisphaeraceae bacterium]